MWSNVAPHVGAWIETSKTVLRLTKTVVAPHVGAWIETLDLDNIRKAATVAPHVGAWIETPLYVRTLWQVSSHPTWVRGLKRMRT